MINFSLFPNLKLNLLIQFWMAQFPKPTYNPIAKKSKVVFPLSGDPFAYQSRWNRVRVVPFRSSRPNLLGAVSCCPRHRLSRVHLKTSSTPSALPPFLRCPRQNCMSDTEKQAITNDYDYRAGCPLENRQAFKGHVNVWKTLNEAIAAKVQRLSRFSILVQIYSCSYQLEEVTENVNFMTCLQNIEKL